MMMAGMMIMPSSGDMALPPLTEADLSMLLAHHASTARLNARLENWADRLPDRPDASEALLLCEALSAYVDKRAADQAALWQALHCYPAHDSLPHTMLAYLQSCDTATTGIADSLLEVLDPGAGGSGRAWPCAEALGFMFRCFFENCRHLLAVEILAILLLGADRLTLGARRLLESRLALSA